MAHDIYTGFWTDWSRGPVVGTTITLSLRSGLLLLSFIASFVTFVGTRLWCIFRLIVHQLLAKSSTNDGIHFQRQSILRNSNTPLSAAWESIQQAWYWRGSAGSNACVRTIPTAVVTLLYASGFIIAGIFSSRVSEAATPYRLVRRNEEGCGFLRSDSEDSSTDGETNLSWLEIQVAQNRKADVYASSCYESEGSFSECNVLPVRSITWTKERIECPFGYLCVDGVDAIRLDTGRIQSAKHLGINQPISKGVDYRCVTECAPLKPLFERGPVYNDTCTELRAQYGTRVSNWTNVYLSCDTPIGLYEYTLRSFYSTDVGEQWIPLPPLNSSARDVTPLLIYSNAVRFIKQNTDPLFGTDPDAKDKSFKDGIPRYVPASPMTALACSDMYQFCNPINNRCTELANFGRINNWGPLDIDLSVAQQATSIVLINQVQFTSIIKIARTLPYLALQASPEEVEYSMPSLSDTQWEIEVAKLFNESLAKLQQAVVNYAAGPLLLPPSLQVEQWWKNSTKVAAYPSTGFLGDLCSAQLVRDAQTTLSFSVLGLGVILGVGLLITIASVVLEPVAAWAQGKTGKGVERGRAWQRDGNLQMQRLLFEERGQGEWIGAADPVPRTRARTTLNFLVDEDKK